MNIKSNEPLFCPYSILVNEGMCNKINDAYTKLFLMLLKAEASKYLI